MRSALRFAALATLACLVVLVSATRPAMRRPVLAPDRHFLQRLRALGDVN